MFVTTWLAIKKALLTIARNASRAKREFFIFTFIITYGSGDY